MARMVSTRRPGFGGQVGVMWALLVFGACHPTHSGRPLREQCPPSRPAEGEACTGASDRYCAFAGDDGAEHVCFCEAERWQCFEKPAAEPAEGAPSPAASAAPAPSGAAAPTGASAVTACPADMELVDTVHCTEVKRTCKRHTRSQPNNLTICHEFAEGTECVGEKRRQRFCIDRYEYPNEKGGHPPVMVSAYDAAGLCAEQGKRLCFESEWTAACEGPNELPFPYGRTRSRDHCNIDNNYVHPDLSKAEHADPAVHGPELTRLDQSVPSGSMATCKSGFGVYDLTGNFDEWVRTERSRGKGKWAGLKGGAWGIVRNACRPVTTSHVAHWSYYFISFRCCSDPDRAALPPPPDDGIALWTPPSEPAPKHPAGKPVSRGFTPSK